MLAHTQGRWQPEAAGQPAKGQWNKSSAVQAELSEQEAEQAVSFWGPAQTWPPGRPTFHRRRNRHGSQFLPPGIKNPQVLGKAGAHPCIPEPTQCLASTCLPTPSPSFPPVLCFSLWFTFVLPHSKQNLRGLTNEFNTIDQKL